jgi:DNA-binding CsgD family transcriptional regulator
VHAPMLRPLERRVLRLTEGGLDDAEIGRRFRRSPDWAARVRVLAEVPHHGLRPRGDVLRPLERRVLRWRAAGVDAEELGPRFRRSPDFLRRVEALAYYRLRNDDIGDGRGSP